ncbi:exosortase A [Haloferula helveola]|uniref:Exosortase A n=1 Tax=Haloferula helveola TaxID=490095 RepID=A0ABN6H421_9BACT|nr:exosortase A [Haloferula helveola]
MRAFVPALLIAAVMSAIYALPPFKEVDSALRLELENHLGAWQLDVQPTPEPVRRVLATDTDFSHALCSLKRVEEMSYIWGTAPTDFAQLSIILSGHDLANSIHRPERCLVAQGHRGLVVNASAIQVPAGHTVESVDSSELNPESGVTVPVTRILSRRELGYGDKDDRKFIDQHCVTYYFFVGKDRITADHTERTLIDIKDRVLKGEAQRWSFVMCTMVYLPGEDREIGDPPDLEIADTKIRQLLTELAEENIDWSRISR